LAVEDAGVNESMRNAPFILTNPAEKSPAISGVAVLLLAIIN